MCRVDKHGVSENPLRAPRRLVGVIRASGEDRESALQTLVASRALKDDPVFHHADFDVVFEVADFSDRRAQISEPFRGHFELAHVIESLRKHPLYHFIRDELQLESLRLLDPAPLAENDQVQAVRVFLDNHHDTVGPIRAVHGRFEVVQVYSHQELFVAFVLFKFRRRQVQFRHHGYVEFVVHIKFAVSLVPETLGGYLPDPSSQLALEGMLENGRRASGFELGHLNFTEV